MSKIPGERQVEHRRNFHGSKGEHLFPHPETYADRQNWTGWDRAYARHLDRHHELVTSPEPMDGDPQVVLDLFAHRELLKTILRKEGQLILALRQKQAAGAEPDEKDVQAVRRIVGNGAES